MIRIGRKFEYTSQIEWAREPTRCGVLCGISDYLTFVDKDEALQYLREHNVDESMIEKLIFQDMFTWKFV